jgi:hypothetical protein
MWLKNALQLIILVEVASIISLKDRYREYAQNAGQTSIAQIGHHLGRCFASFTAGRHRVGDGTGEENPS